jgi:hypothetical protein
MLLVAGGIGMIGGLGAELLIKRVVAPATEETGIIELPHRLTPVWVAFGFPASLFVGAIAAVAAQYFLAPITETVMPAVGTTAATVTRTYDLVKLVPLALIVGSAGPAFLASAQSRLLSALNAQKVDIVAGAAQAQLAQLTVAATAAVSGAVHEAAADAIPSLDAGAVQGVAEKVEASIRSTLSPQLVAAQDQIAAIVPGSSSIIQR